MTEVIGRQRQSENLLSTMVEISSNIQGLQASCVKYCLKMIWELDHYCVADYHERYLW